MNITLACIRDDCKCARVREIYLRLVKRFPCLDVANTNNPHERSHRVSYMTVVYEMRTLSRFVNMDRHNWLSAFMIAFLRVVLAHLCTRET